MQAGNGGLMGNLIRENKKWRDSIAKKQRVGISTEQSGPMRQDYVQVICISFAHFAFAVARIWA
jgi:hypothetical protein